MEVDDPLKLKVGDFATPVDLQRANEFEPHLFLNGDRFLSYVENTFTLVDVLTYSLGKFTVLTNVNRLAVGMRTRKSHKCRERRHVPNNHIKLFICYTNHAVNAVYLGSQNLTMGTNMNVMYRVQFDHHQILVDMFETIWKQAL